MKFGRIYAMTIEAANFATVLGRRVNISSGGQNALTLSYPLTLELEIERSTLSSCNRGHFRIINLREDTRRQIFHDRWDTTNYRQIILKAGYVSDPQIPIVFQGNILSAYNYRRKQDWVTDIEALDGGFGTINGQVATSLPSGTSIRDAIVTALQTMPNVVAGAISTIGDGGPRGLALTGNSWDAIGRLAPDSESFIDNERANVMGKNEYIAQPNDPFVISSQSGMLETPRRYQDRIDVKMLFEPRLRVAQVVEVQSAETYYNGIYVIKGVEHRGTISGAVNGELTTTLSVWRGTDALKAVASA